MIAALLFGAMISTPAAVILGAALGRLEAEAAFSRIQKSRRQIAWAIVANELLERRKAKITKRRKKLRLTDPTLLLNLNQEDVQDLFKKPYENPTLQNNDRAARGLESSFPARDGVQLAPG